MAAWENLDFDSGVHKNRPSNMSFQSHGRPQPRVGRAASGEFHFTPFYRLFRENVAKMPSFTDFWTYSKAPPFASKNTDF